MTRPLIFLLLFLLFCLPACLAQAGLGASSNPFAATGLLAHPDETAEEILIRAHNQDGDAVILAVTGYALGIGGFPKNNGVADDMNYAYRPSGWEYTFQFLKLLNESAGVQPPTPDPEECLAASRSPVAPLFKQSGIFDLDSVCADVGYAADLGPDFIKFDSSLSSLFSDLSERPLSEDEDKAIQRLNLIEPRLHWEIERALIDRELPQSQQILNLIRLADQQVTGGMSSPQLHAFITDTALNVSSVDSNAELVKDVIRKAHQGDAIAAWQMAENYRIGAYGFPKDFYLELEWLERAAALGSRKAVDNLTLLYYFHDSIGQPHTYHAAHRALHYGSPELKEVFAGIIANIEKKFSPEDVSKLRHNANIELENLKKEGYQTK